MPLQNNLRIIMAKQKIDTITDLMAITGLSRNALNKLWKDEDLESAKLETLMIICDQLQIKLSDLIEYLPGEKRVIPVKEKKPITK